MSGEIWKVTFSVWRQKAGGKAHFEDFPMQVDPDEYVLDGIERIWAFNDRSLCFRHACHHSTCGACGMRVNGVEKLTCITPIRDVAKNGSKVRVEPLRNFPVVSDLVVEMSRFYLRMDRSDAQQVVPAEKACLPYERKALLAPELGAERLVDCIECGLCISACPVALTSQEYAGPAVLAAVHQELQMEKRTGLWEMADSASGVWRCHSAFECSAVCPSNVDPGWRILDLRKQAIQRRVRKFFVQEEKA